jgi:hypothetical protein
MFKREPIRKGDPNYGVMGQLLDGKGDSRLLHDFLPTQS